MIADCSVDVKDIELGLKECTFRMTIPSTDLSDTGTYTVKVKNKHGSAESSVSLICTKQPLALCNRIDNKWVIPAFVSWVCNAKIERWQQFLLKRI